MDSELTMEKPKVDDEVLASAMHDENRMAAHTERPVWDTREKYCEPGFKGIFASRYVALCAAFSALGGLLFGYDQVIKISVGRVEIDGTIAHYRYI
jgi:hypothetical protein